MFSKLEKLFIMQQLRERKNTLEEEIQTILRNGYDDSFIFKNKEIIEMIDDILERLKEDQNEIFN